ncbi:hypothetical protein, partial [Polyangium sp. 15x6]|uniref:hypothetical protein n=1 Tax=Polyangium sp. 15x6 TaxID=3042687 RepID=UPI00249A731E
RPEDDPNHYQPSGDLSDMHPGGHGNTSGHDLFDGLAIDTSHLARDRRTAHGCPIPVSCPVRHIYC